MKLVYFFWRRTVFMGYTPMNMQTKTCKRCGTEKPTTDFYTPIYRYPNCKPCHRIIVQSNQQVRKEHYNEYRLRYYHQHPEKIKHWHENWLKAFELENGISYSEYTSQRTKERRATDPVYAEAIRLRDRLNRKKYADRIQEYRRKYYDENRKRLIEKALLRYRRNKDQINERKRKQREIAKKRKQGLKAK